MVSGDEEKLAAELHSVQRGTRAKLTIGSKAGNKWPPLLMRKVGTKFYQLLPGAADYKKLHAQGCKTTKQNRVMN